VWQWNKGGQKSSLINRVGEKPLGGGEKIFGEDWGAGQLGAGRQSIIHGGYSPAGERETAIK